MTLIVTIVAFAGLMAMMSVGVLIGGRRLRGSCGGVGNCACEEADLPRACDLVPGPGEPRCLPDDNPSCPGPTDCPHH